MGNDRHARIAALTGLAAAVLVVIGFGGVMPKPPAPDSSAADVAGYFVDHHNAVRVGVLILTFAVGFYLWFLGTLSSALRVISGNPRLPTIAFAGGIWGGGFFLIGLTMIATAAYRPEETPPELTRALNDIGLLVGAPAAAGFAVLFGATALVILRSGVLPDWSGWVSAAGAIGGLFALGVIFTDHGTFGPDGFMGLWLPIASFEIPLAVLSIVLYQALGRPGGIVGAVGDAVGAARRAATGG